MAKILFIGEDLEAQLLESLEADTAVTTEGFGSGLPHLEYATYEHLGAGKVIKLAMSAEKSGFDALVIGCFYDPGLHEARELLTIPVIGVCEASLHAASTLCAGKFSVLVGREKWIPRMSDNSRGYGFESKIASWRIMDLTVPDMINTETTQAAILREATIAVEQDLAEAICLGCTGMSGQARAAQKELDVPVLDPVLMGLKTAEFRIQLHKRLGISHSKKGGYEAPPEKEFQEIMKNRFSPGKAVKKIAGLFRHDKP